MSHFFLLKRQGILTRTLLIVLLFFINGCGFTPVLSQKEKDKSVATHLMQVRVNRIPERMGQKLRALLQEKMGGGTPLYALDVSLTQQQSSVAIGIDSTTNRYQLRVQASYTLKKIHDPYAFMKGESQALCSWNVLTQTDPLMGSAEYSDLVAGETALDHALTLIAQDIYNQVTVQLARDPSLKNAPKEDGFLKSEKDPFYEEQDPFSLGTDEGTERKTGE